MKRLPKILKSRQYTIVSRIQKVIVFLGLFLLLSTSYYLLSTAPKAHAQEFVRTYTVIPPTVEHKLNPGDKTEGVIKIINDSSSPLSFKVDVQDYIVSDTQGTPNLVPPNTLNGRHSAASWIGVYPNSFTIPPKTRQEFRYYLQTPPDAAPGGHYAAVVFTPLAVGDKESTGATVYTQIGTLFYITIAGPIKEQASVTKFLTDAFQEYGPVKILTQIKNMGDLHISPKGTVTVNGLFLNEKQNLPAYNIFPETARDFENTLGKMFMLGRYKASLVASYGQNNNLPLTATFYFWVFPWRLAVVITLIVIAVILGMMYWKRRKKNTREQTELNTEATQNDQPNVK